MAKGTKTGGRKKGTPNKSGGALRDLARGFTGQAVDTIVALLKSDNETIRLAAARELLDRGHGRPTQAVEMGGNDGGPLIVKVLGGNISMSDI